MKTLKPRTRFDRQRVQLTNFEPTLTKQASKEECDINTILRKHSQGNLLSHVNTIQGQFGDFSEIPDYQSSLDAVLNAQAAFANLPSKVRARFNHDPGALISFLEDDLNRDEAIALGLLETPNTEAPTSSQPPSAPKVEV